MITSQIKDRFQWAKQLFPILKQFENDGVCFYEVVAAHADVRNRNDRVYSSDELNKSATSLSERPLNINHDPNRILPFPGNQVLAARYEDGVVECIIQIADEKVNAMIESGEISKVSIEGLYLDDSKNTGETEYPTSLHFKALALLTKDDEPGDPEAQIIRDHRRINVLLPGLIKERLTLLEQQTFSKFETAEDEKVCDTCAPLDGKSWASGEVPDEMQPPIHPNCRCALTDYEANLSEGKIVLLKELKMKMSVTNVINAEWSVALINTFPDSSFAYVEPGGKKDEEGKTVPRGLRHLPYKDAKGDVDLPHLRNALARLSQTQLPAQAKAEARATLVAAAKKAGIETSMDEALSKLAKANEDYHIAREFAISILEQMDDNPQNYDGRSTGKYLHPQNVDPTDETILYPNVNVSAKPPLVASLDSPPVQKVPATQGIGAAQKPDMEFEGLGSGVTTDKPNMTYPETMNPLAVTNDELTVTSGLQNAVVKSTKNFMGVSLVPRVAEKSNVTKKKIRIVVVSK